jgi:hypothetical protein
MEMSGAEGVEHVLGRKQVPVANRRWHIQNVRSLWIAIGVKDVSTRTIANEFDEI